MKNLKLPFTLAFTVVLVSSLIGEPSFSDGSSSAEGLPPKIIRPLYREDELLVKFKPGVGESGVQELTQSLGGVSTRQLGKRVNNQLSKLSRWTRLKLGAGHDLETQLERLKDDPRVEVVEPNYLLTLDAIPNDWFFQEQWGLYNTGQYEAGVVGADIDAVNAWNIQTGSASVVVAIVDTGLDLSHPDLDNNLWINPLEISGNGIDDDGNGYVDDIVGYDFGDNDNNPTDQIGHGTFLAGIIAAEGNNNLGVTGVAWDARIMPLKFSRSDGTIDVLDAIEAIEYATSMGAQVINASWGSYSYSQLLRDAIQEAGQNGVLFVASAGNDGLDTDATPHYPSSYDEPNLISVAATNSADARWASSNYGKNSIHLGAPGEDIVSTFPFSNYLFDRSGTSYSTAYVSGVAALLLSQPSPPTDPSALKELILDRTEQIPSMAEVTSTGGRLNALLPLDCDPSELVLSVRAPVASFSVTEGDPTLIRGQVTSCGHTVEGYTLSASFDNGEADLTLLDDGMNNDVVAGDGVFAGYWMPQTLGSVQVQVTASHPSLPELTDTINGSVSERVRYQHESTAYSWTDATSGTAHALGSDGSVTVPIGFEFEFYGLPYSDITINANGLLAFASPVPLYGNLELPDPAFPNNLIAPYWDNLDHDVNGNVYVLTEGAAPNRRFTIAWVEVGRASVSGTVSFQATLYESSNEIIFNYQDVTVGGQAYDNGANAVVGVEDQNGLNATVYSSLQPLLEDGAARRFYPVSAGPDLIYRVNIETWPINTLSGSLVMSVVDGDGANNNYFSILRFSTDGDIALSPILNGDASGSFLPGPAHIGDAKFYNEITQPKVFGNNIGFLLKATRNGMFQPFPDTYAFYLVDSDGEPYPTTDPFGTDSLFAIEIENTQPFAEVFESDFAVAEVEIVGAPTADAGGPYAGQVNQPVDFDGTGSSDPEGQPLSYTWDFGDGSNDTGSNPAHTYSVAGEYTVSLVVDDGELHSRPSTTMVVVTGDQQLPIADAGPDQTVGDDETVLLDGSNSTDPDGSITTYSWTQTSGPEVSLTGADTAEPSFVAPDVQADTTLTFELTVTDNSGGTASDTVDVLVQDSNISPTADAGPDQTVNAGATVNLNGTASSDPDGAISSYQWSQTAGPAVTLSDVSSPSPTFTAPSVEASTLLSFELTVTDDGGLSASDSVDVTVNPAAGSPLDDLIALIEDLLESLGL